MLKLRLGAMTVSDGVSYGTEVVWCYWRVWFHVCVGLRLCALYPSEYLVGPAF